MEISYFNEFVILAETRNYWAASERLYIGQSSLSKHIKTLETQLGAPLFDRTSRKVELTEFGAKMLPYAQSIARLQFQYEAAAADYLNGETEELTIACIPSLARYNIVDVLLRFQRDFPNVQVQTVEADTLVVRKQLLRRECDLALYRDSIAYLEHEQSAEEKLIKIPYCTDRLVAVLPRKHVLANREQLELSELRDENFALIKKDSMPYMLCMRACRSAGFAPKVVYTSHSLDSICDMVTKGSCVSLLFDYQVRPPVDSVLELEPPFSVVPVTPEIQTTLYLSYLKDQPLTAAAKQFVAYCKEQKMD